MPPEGDALERFLHVYHEQILTNAIECFLIINDERNITKYQETSKKNCKIMSIVICFISRNLR